MCDREDHRENLCCAVLSTMGVLQLTYSKFLSIPQRIVAGQWKFPPVSLSDDCKSLIEGILQTNPSQRMTISDILMHPWYRTELPEGVDTMSYPERPQAGLQVSCKCEFNQIWEMDILCMGQVCTIIDGMYD